MNNKVFRMHGYRERDEYDTVKREEVFADHPHSFMFIAYDLTECPEDATLSRDLFDSSDLIRALRYGMKLGAMGYCDVVIDWEDSEDGD